MPKLNANISEIFSKTAIFSVATASKDGLPNVVPMSFVKIHDTEDTILIADNLMNKGLKNIEENPWIALSVWDTTLNQAYQIKGSAKIIRSGREFDDATAWVEKAFPGLKPKSAILLKVTNIYNCQPGPDLGKEL